MDYREAGVDIEAGRDFVNQIRQMVEKTYRPEVLGGLGGFGGCFEIPPGYQQPVLVSGTDGVGTKLKIASAINQHHTIGIDLVAMCVNDILTCGAEPLFFLDYLATGKLQPQQLTQVVAGVSQGCLQAGCALLGGETAEMPGFYQPGEYDIAGFCVGIVEKSRMLNGSKVQLGDIAIGLASSGIHSNGFSLVRKIALDRNLDWSDSPEEFNGQSLGEVCLTPTSIYVQPILAAIKAGINIHGMAHITGGGLPENLPRCLGANQAVEINSSSWPILPIFKWISQTGDVSIAAMYDTFNMGIGFVVIVSANEAEQTLNWFQSQNIDAYQIGKIIPGEGNLMGLT
ncbi:MAG: phosphoribosylformylglycinamidine cyclo-ligase [Microcoleaceae cyanobacterium]